MNKIANILISVVFLISFIGIQVNKHYSQGKLYDVAIFNEAESCCDISETCEMENMGEGQCEHQTNHDLSCKTTTEVFQLHDNFINEKYSTYTVKSIDLFIVTVLNNFDLNTFSPLFSNRELSSSPPTLSLDFQAESGIFIC